MKFVDARIRRTTGCGIPPDESQLSDHDRRLGGIQKKACTGKPVLVMGYRH